MSRNLEKFLLLMWKNWLIQKRHVKQTFFEILSPVVFTLLVVLIRSLVEPDLHEQPTTYTTFNISRTTFVGKTLYSRIAYSPNNTIINSIMAEVGLKFIPRVKMDGFDNGQDMERYLKKNSTMYETLCGIQFDDSLSTAVELPKDIHVTIRFPGESRKIPTGITVPLNWRTNTLFPLYQDPGPRQDDDNEGGYPAGYYEERFISTQHFVAMAIINKISEARNSTKPEVDVALQRLPYPPYVGDPLLNALSVFIGMVMMLSFIYFCINTVKVITNEKEKQVKEIMKIMGLPTWLHWLAWFIKSFLYALISISIISILFKIHWTADLAVFQNSDITVLFAFLCLYMSATITFCFMISAFCSRANMAAMVASLFWSLSYFPFTFLQKQYESLTLGAKLVMCLCSNSAMGFGFQLIMMFEGTSEGLQWRTVLKGVTPDDTFTLGHVMLMLFIDTILYFIVTLYIESINPGEYGLPRPWYFPVTRSFWCGRRHNMATVEDSTGLPQQPKGDMFETDPNLYPGIRIQQLRKVFGKKVAVRGLTLNMYEDQITALLGHNGAGKTTTMSMLTGIYPPTKGTAEVIGHDISSDMPKVRASLGLCPQHNVLFDDLTVKEHLYFFGKLKGLNKEDIDNETNKYIELLELKPKADARSKTLSGGMKRKLSVGIALCGNSKVVMLDEPTAGMDPAARRAVWDILQAEKKGRTMLLTTHFMDEADLLGDRIAIMAGGTLQCCGSSFFLKKKYGAGYHLTLEKSHDSDVMKITQLLRKYIPNIQVETNVGAELTYRLSEEYLNIFERMLGDLESFAASYGVLNYGISLTTLEEVFMKVGADHGQEEQQNALELNGKVIHDINETNGDLEFNRHSSESRLDLGDNLMTGFFFYFNQFKAMMMKKTFSTLRSWVLTLIQLAIPVIFLILTIFVSRQTNSNRNLPELDITLDSYDHPITVVEGDGAYRNDYYENIEKLGHIIEVQDNLTRYVLDRADANLPVVRNRFIVGASFINNSVRGWFNNIPFHGLPLSLNLIHNAILHKTVGKDYNIRITNSPLPYTIDTKFQQLQDVNGIGFQIAFNVGFGLVFVSAFYILFCVKERVSKAKHLQFVSGVNVLIFWSSSFLFDFIHFVVLSIFLIITLGAFQEEGFRTASELGRVFFVLLLFGFAMLPLVYLFSFLFSIPATGFTITTTIFVFTGCFAFMIVILLQHPMLDLKHIADILDWMFTLVPQYSVCSSLYQLNIKYEAHKFCDLVAKEDGGSFIIQYLCLNKKQCCSMKIDYYSTIFSKEGISRNLFFFFIIGSLLFIILIILEYQIPSKVIYHFQNNEHRPPDEPSEDDDVANERHRVKDITPSDLNAHSLILRDVSKYYDKFLAVNKLSVGIKRAECFGLLGVNGAGKTSTFKMLTGDEKISFGDAWVNGMSLKQDIKKVHRVIGYCPQFDALLDNLTGRETMKMFCLLRGVHESEINFLCEKLAQEFSFTRHIDKKVKQYSGGNKRKLSTAVALIGDPCVVYLDEPSTGMDPVAKRMLWNGLCKVRDSGKCIVLTSHSMEECEALCTRLAIMVNGTFKCLGSTQHLKSKFSEGYTLTVKVRKGDVSREITEQEIKPIDDYIKQNFPHAMLREKYQELLTYYISKTDIPWSRMFGLLEQGKQFLNIEDYSLGQCSLEQDQKYNNPTTGSREITGDLKTNTALHTKIQVFLSFTKHQKQE